MKEKTSNRRCKMEATLDGGLSWLVVISSMMQQFISMGTHTVFGLFYIYLLKEFNESKATTALVGSISFGLMFVLGPLTTAICHRYGNPAAALAGTIIHTLGLILTSFVSNLATMFLTYSLVMAIGSSLIYYSSIVILEEYFYKKLSFTNGIALSGAGAGTLALSPIVQHFLTIYNWRTTLRILGGFATMLLLCSVIHYLVPPPKRSRHNDVTTEEKADKPKVLDKSLFKNKAYDVYVAAITCILFGFYIPFVHLVRYCQDLNISAEQGAILVGYLAIAQTVGKIVFGRIADHPRVNRIALLQYALLVSCLATTLLPILTSIESIAVYCWVYGIHDGCFVMLIAVITGDLVGRGKMAQALGMVYFFSCMTMTIGPPIAGMLYDFTGSYEAAFFMAGAFTFVGICLLFLVPILVPSEIAKRQPCLEEITMLSSEGNTDGGTSTSLDDHITPMPKKDIMVKSDSCYQVISKSGTKQLMVKNRRTLNEKDKMPNENENRFSWMIERYFSMEHLVDQRDSLISRIYSRENVSHLLPKESNIVRETDV